MKLNDNSERRHKQSRKIYGSTTLRKKPTVFFWPIWSRYTCPDRKMYVQILTKLEPVKRRRGIEATNRLYLSVSYLKKSIHGRVQVWKKMFLGTLGMKEATTLNWIYKMWWVSGGHRRTWVKISATSKQKFRDSTEHLTRFLVGLPKIESHYCRSSSNKLYI